MFAPFTSPPIQKRWTRERRTNFKIEHNQTIVLLLVEGELVIAGFAFFLFSLFTKS